MSCLIYFLSWRDWEPPKQLSCATEAANFSSQVYLAASGKGKMMSHMNYLCSWRRKRDSGSSAAASLISWIKIPPVQTTRGVRERAQQLKNQAVDGTKQAKETVFIRGDQPVWLIQRKRWALSGEPGGWVRWCCLQGAFTEPHPTPGYGIMELSWLQQQQQQDSLLLKILVPRPVALWCSAGCSWETPHVPAKEAQGTLLLQED